MTQSGWREPDSEERWGGERRDLVRGSVEEIVVVPEELWGGLCS